MADFGSSPEMDGGLGKVQEVSKEQVEQFQEQMRAAQAALQALQKEEGKARKRDGNLAALLSAFVKNSQDMDILQLIVFCLNMSIPVNFVVAVLSLFYLEIYKEIAIQFKKENLAEIEHKEQALLKAVEEEEKKDLEPRKQFHEQHLPDEVKKRINEWVRDMLLLSLENRKKTLDNVYVDGLPHLTPVQLTTKILEKYLLSVNIEGSYDRIKTFGEFILNGVRGQLQKEEDKQLAKTNEK